MGPMDDPAPEPRASDAPPNAPAPTPGERRLAHPPSDRYRSVEPAAAAPRPGSVARAAVFGILAAVAAAAVIVLVGGVLALSSALLVVAPIVGWAVAWALRRGAGASVVPGRLAVFALLVAVGAVLLGQLGLWLYARTEGGVLPFTDYLGQVYGVLVPLQFLFAAPVAWATAR
jgi:hypothetical protein